MAVTMVIIAHFLQWQWTNPILTKIPFVHGVTLFFVLSGYLISQILIQNRDKYEKLGQSKIILIKNFYQRRFLRIFPIYYILVFGLFFFNYKNTREIFLWLLTYTSNIYQSINNVYVGDFNHFWSLAVEEQFYLFWPFVILFLKPNKTLIIIILTILISLATKGYLYMYIGKWMATSYFTFSCLHALGLGALLAYLKLYQPKTETKLSNPIWLYLTFSLYIVSLIIQNQFKLNWFREIFDEFFFAVLSFFIVLRASENRFRGIIKIFLENHFITYAGKISYGMYVYHLFIPTLIYFIAPKIGISISSKYTFFIVAYFLTFIVAYISWKLIEYPINKLKNKVPYLKHGNNIE
jgi:peptidoglycan/LPS O-acetylase OafA/YrhL